ALLPSPRPLAATAEPIVAGLISDNTAFILQGGLIVGLMAVLIYDAMGLIEAEITRRIGLRAA
ncbi:hypothetical protein ACC723_38375, partial [Rhizobium ruizarguesonis]